MIGDLLNKFEPITLKEMDAVSLQDREDTKFVFHRERLGYILSELLPYYRILEVENNRSTDYESLYYDTKDFDFYIQHHNGKLNRSKVRYRKYLSTGLTFLEVKFKSNKGRTIKKRIKQSDITPDLTDDSKKFVNSKIQGFANKLEAKLWVYYTRITLVHKGMSERLTVDLNLSYKANDKEANLKDLVIAELKRDRGAMRSDFLDVMRKHKIFEMSYSKYCMGTLLLNSELKRNRFKPKLHSLKKLNHGIPINAA